MASRPAPGRREEPCLSAGTRLGPYEIVSVLGAGGMGEVYKARDTRLDRVVAVKVLPPTAADPESRARFEREARAISRLGHPHICTLFDIGREGRFDFLVVEYLEGETLAQRLSRPGARTPHAGRPTIARTPATAESKAREPGRPLPLHDALQIGSELAEALASAHKAGVVHRDLKPANVMLTASGAKVLDFGVARLAAGAAVGDGLAPTCAVEPLTDPGTRLGTLPYMSPEQVEGKEADRRSDIFALGAILYEMATGRRPFPGDSPASVAAAILEREPEPLVACQPLAPPALQHLVSTCLAKDPDARWQEASDVARALRWIAASGGGASSPAVPAGPARARRVLAGAAIVAAAIALIGIGALGASMLLRTAAPPPAVVRLSMTAPAGARIVNDTGAMALSPDGRRLVFAMVDADGVQQLWVRALDGSPPQPLAGTRNALFPFWSPDGRFVGFFAGGKLWRVAAGGGSPEEVCSAPSGRGGTWSRDDVIVFAPLSNGPLLRVPAGGGEPVTVARPDKDHHRGLRFPHFLPDGRHVLFLAVPGRTGEFDVMIGALDGTPPRHLFPTGSAPVYAPPDYLLFTREGRLVAQRIDLERLEPRGEVIQLADRTAPTYYDGSPRVSASAGVLIDGGLPPNMRLAWLDREGRTVGTVLLPADRYASPYLSPDGRKAVVAKWSSDNRADLWLVDLDRSAESRLTSDGRAAGVAYWGSDPALAWSQQGDRVAYLCDVSEICQVAVSGTAGAERLTATRGTYQYPAGWSPDGRWLVFARLEGGTQYDLWLMPMHGPREPVPYLRTPFDENTAAISPDGRWLAYDSNETGTPQIYVRSFPTPGEKHPVSVSGGVRAQWSEDGRQIFIWTSAGPIGTTLGPVYVVDVETKPGFKAGTPRRLLTPPRNTVGLSASRDLQRFLAALPPEGWAPTIEVTLNWQAALK